tara:strand:- start:144 stop:539 length:396 start_codon:yes stop_codon:yes gene_type:complete
MGYTNYWYQTRAFTDKEWYEIKTYLLFRHNSFTLDDLDKEIKISHLSWDENDHYIQFNGKNAKLSCEDFTLYKNIREPLYKDDNVEFNFCKTRQLPYDMMVWKLLKFINFVVLDPWNKQFKISNDNGVSYD